MKHKQTCQMKHLITTLEGEISLCRCGVYHVRINATTLHLTTAQFNAAARLFKLAFGIATGRRLNKTACAPGRDMEYERLSIQAMQRDRSPWGFPPKQEDEMIHETIWDKNSNKGREIDIRACDCGSIHLSFFGRTTFHLSRQEFLDFSKGVVEVRSRLKQEDQEDRFDIRKMNGLNH